MGFPVPTPGKITMKVGDKWVDLTQHMEQYGWHCTYCHTVQSAARDACCNCGAPKPDVLEAAAFVAEQFRKAQGIP